MSDDNNLISQWEQMGSSTGATLGRFIGIAAETGLRAVDQVLLTPLAKTRDEVNKTAQNAGVDTETTRSQVWSEMGKQYGEKLGNALGIAMDSAIEMTKAGMMGPQNQNLNKQETSAKSGDQTSQNDNPQEQPTGDEAENQCPNADIYNNLG